MVTGTEIMGGIGALKTALDIAKTIKDISDASARYSAVIELQEKIVTAQMAQSAFLDRIRELEEEVAGFKKWEAEKQRYELKNVGQGSLAYMLKPNARGTEPAHWVCANCYDGEQRISKIQTLYERSTGYTHSCPACKTKLQPQREALDEQKMSPCWLS